MNAQLKPTGFPLPSSLRVIPGTERAQAAYPYHIQFSPEDDQRFWFYNSMHFPEPMSAFDMVTAEAAYCALGSANTRVHCLPTTLGIDHRRLTFPHDGRDASLTDPDVTKARVIGELLA